MIATRKLLLVIGALWFLAGVNILIIGLITLSHWLLWWVLLGAFVVFLFFEVVVFSRVLIRYTKRVFSFIDPKMPFWRAFDTKGYVTIAIMMAAGIILRFSGVVPGWLIALFYTGLGAALFVSSVLYVATYLIHRNPKLLNAHHPEKIHRIKN